jgi:hypothetical protein
MAAVQALLFFINTMFGGSTNLNPAQQQLLVSSPQYQTVMMTSPGAVTVKPTEGGYSAVIVDTNEL